MITRLFLQSSLNDLNFYSDLQSQVIMLKNNTPTSITVINTTNIDRGSGGPEISLTVPLELLEKFINENETTLRIISATYRKVSTIFLNNPDK